MLQSFSGPSVPVLRERESFLDAPTSVINPPNLLQAQVDSYKWFFDNGLGELFAEITPIEDYGGNLELHFLDYYLDAPKHTEETARERNATFEAPLRCAVRLVNKKTGEVKEQEVYLGEFPVMTPRGTFIINGVERVVVSQLIRSPGVFFTSNYTRGVIGMARRSSLTVARGWSLRPRLTGRCM